MIFIPLQNNLTIDMVEVLFHMVAISEKIGSNLSVRTSK